MVANIITLSRLLLTFVIIAVFGWSRPVDIALIFTIAGIFILDALDGYIVRKRNETTTLGEMLDTLADRIVENTFWIYFTASGHLNVWMPTAVMARGFLTDSLQRFWGYAKRMDTRLDPLTRQPCNEWHHQDARFYQRRQRGRF